MLFAGPYQLVGSAQHVNYSLTLTPNLYVYACLFRMISKTAGPILTGLLVAEVTTLATLILLKKLLNNSTRSKPRDEQLVTNNKILI